MNKLWTPMVVLVSIAIVATGGGCSSTLPISDATIQYPLFRQIDARVGTYYTAEARSAIVGHILHDAELGEASVGRFEKTFSAMFSEAMLLPDWPPWRSSELVDIDGVIELEEVHGSLVIGNDINNPDRASVSYRVCLFEPDARKIQCWSTSASQSHQRRPFECFPNNAACLTPLFEIVIRDAIAQFMVKFENDGAVTYWAEQLSRNKAQE